MLSVFDSFCILYTAHVNRSQQELIVKSGRISHFLENTISYIGREKRMLKWHVVYYIPVNKSLYSVCVYHVYRWCPPCTKLMHYIKAESSRPTLNLLYILMFLSTLYLKVVVWQRIEHKTRTFWPDSMLYSIRVCIENGEESKP